MSMNMNPRGLVFLGAGTVAAIIMSIAAVNNGILGHAICGIGLALLGAAGYLQPATLKETMKKGFLKLYLPQPGIAVLSGVGIVLLIVGLALRWVDF